MFTIVETYHTRWANGKKRGSISLGTTGKKKTNKRKGPKGNPAADTIKSGKLLFFPCGFSSRSRLCIIFVAIEFQTPNTYQDHLNVASQKKSRGSRCIVLTKGNLAAALLLLAVLLAGVDNGTAVEDLLATLSVVESLAGNDAVDFCKDVLEGQLNVAGIKSRGLDE